MTSIFHFKNFPISKLVLLLFGFGFSSSSQAQLTITSGSTFFISGGSTVTVQNMDVVSNANITGTGLLSLTGTSSSNINMNGFDLPQLEVWKTGGANATLTGNARAIGGATNVGLSFNAANTGLLNLGAFNFILNNTATTSGASNTTGFVNAVSTGQLMKEVTTNLTGFNMPVGENTGTAEYSPVSLTTTSGTGTIGVRVVDIDDPAKPARSTEYITRYWPITQSGNTVLSATGSYQATDEVIDGGTGGTEALLYGFYWDAVNAQWRIGTAGGGAANTATANITQSSGDLYAMNAFVFSSPKTFLQGPYDATTGLMSDALRAANIIPLSDPYRSRLGYSHVVRNSPVESVNPAVLAVTGNNAIVDWVYVEMRNNAGSPGNSVLFTRSALLQRDGDVVDLDGLSPVYFKDIIPGNYTVAIRHRNHLPLSTEPSVPVAYNEMVGNTFDFRTQSDANIYGPATAFKSGTHPTLGAINLMWSGNTDSTLAGVDNIKNSSSPSDITPIVNGVNNHPSNIFHLSSFAGYVNVYTILDVNMDAKVFNSATPSDVTIVVNNVGNHPSNTFHLGSYVVNGYLPF